MLLFAYQRYSLICRLLSSGLWWSSHSSQFEIYSTIGDQREPKPGECTKLYHYLHNLILYGSSQLARYKFVGARVDIVTQVELDAARSSYVGLLRTYYGTLTAID